MKVRERELVDELVDFIKSNQLDYFNEDVELNQEILEENADNFLYLLIDSPPGEELIETWEYEFEISLKDYGDELHVIEIYRGRENVLSYSLKIDEGRLESIDIYINENEKF